MRLIATLTKPTNGVVRLMLYAADGGAYLFQYASLNDGPCEFDGFYEDMVTAQKVAHERFGIDQSAWAPIEDPQPSCQHDWIAPTRKKRDEVGNILTGQFENVPERRPE